MVRSNGQIDELLTRTKTRKQCETDQRKATVRHTNVLPSCSPPRFGMGRNAASYEERFILQQDPSGCPLCSGRQNQSFHRRFVHIEHRGKGGAGPFWWLPNPAPPSISAVGNRVASGKS